MHLFVITRIDPAGRQYPYSLLKSWYRTIAVFRQRLRAFLFSRPIDHTMTLPF